MQLLRVRWTWMGRYAMRVMTTTVRVRARWIATFDVALRIADIRRQVCFLRGALSTAPPPGDKSMDPVCAFHSAFQRREEENLRAWLGVFAAAHKVKMAGKLAACARERGMSLWTLQQWAYAGWRIPPGEYETLCRWRDADGLALTASRVIALARLSANARRAELERTRPMTRSIVKTRTRPRSTKLDGQASTPDPAVTPGPAEVEQAVSTCTKEGA